MSYYVYLLCRPNGKPFYVGKGKGARIFDHEHHARSHPMHKCQNPYKCRLIKKIWKSGGEIQRYIVLETTDEQEALAYECELIGLYGRDSLCNLTDGGEGISGYKATDKRRAQISAVARRPENLAKLAKSREKAHTPEARQKQSDSIRKRYQDPRFRELLSRKQQEISARPEVREMRRAKTKASWQNPEVRAKRIQKLKEVVSRPEVRAKRRASMAKTIATPGFAERKRAILKAAVTPELREKISTISRQRWQDPESRAKMAKAIKASQTPEVCAKKSASAKLRAARQREGKPTVCIIDGCDRKIRCRSMCATHYEHWRKAKS